MFGILVATILFDSSTVHGVSTLCASVCFMAMAETPFSWANIQYAACSPGGVYPNVEDD